MLRLLGHLRFSPARALFLYATSLFAAPLASPQSQSELIDLEAARALFKSGHYQEALQATAVGKEERSWDDSWHALEGQILLYLGRYEDAFDAISESLERRPYNLRLRLQAREAALHTSRQREADEHLEMTKRIISRRVHSSFQADSIVALGEAALLFGVEPRIVLENFFKRAQQELDATPSAYLAPGHLALEKHDYRLASRAFQEGLAVFPEDPDLLHGLARSFIETNRQEMIQYADQALQANPTHIPSLLLLAEHLIDGESYDESRDLLQQVLDVNPVNPMAYALLSAIAYIQHDEDEGDRLRKKALATWNRNPQVDHTIGKLRSQRYLFKEGAFHQRMALLYDSELVPARIQLAQDLLRLGREDEGWELAFEAHEQDPYDIAAYNLVTLRDKLEEFETLETERFRLRMAPREAAIYGPRALELLEQAYHDLSRKYGLEIDDVVTVEIYPDQSDFEVRTFGMPGNPGFLGVCFGPLITMNSPASQRANWEAVLWHEFCHTVTLAKTRNRMPRWLSEGISVYEERQANTSWGRLMSIDDQKRILAGRMQPISDMSAAFIRAQSNEDIQFAYFQSYLVVRFLIESFGEEAMRKVLDDLAEGIKINDALIAHMDSMDTLEEDFLLYAQSEARKLGGEYRLQEPEGLVEGAMALIDSRPSYSKAFDAAMALLEAEKWAEARAAFEALSEKAGYIPGEKNPLAPLARVYRELDETALEIQTLSLIASQEGDRLDVVSRLAEIASENQDWPDLSNWAQAWLAINPMAETPWRHLLKASESLSHHRPAIAAGQSLLTLEPPDLASLHYRVARQQMAAEPAAARRSVLMALEEAPRFRQAYDLLLELQAARPAEPERAPSLAPESLLDLQPLALP